MNGMFSCDVPEYDGQDFKLSPSTTKATPLSASDLRSPKPVLRQRVNLSSANISSFVEVGVDEAGRGSLFGPLVTAAVIFPYFEHPEEIPLLSSIQDSKLMTQRARDILRVFIMENALAWTVDFATVEEIEEHNVLGATLLSMRRCVERLLTPKEGGGEAEAEAEEGGGGGGENGVTKIDHIAVDGNQWVPFKNIPFSTEVKGDRHFLHIAAASILAKTTRDQWILHFAQINPMISIQYGLNMNKGYGTKSHLNGLKQYGCHSMHRKKFKPCAEALQKKNETENEFTCLLCVEKKEKGRSPSFS